MKERPVILKLNQQLSVNRPCGDGWESDRAYESIYISVAHIESFSWYGLTHLKMTSGERIQVTETPEEIITLIKDACGGGSDASK